jgi:hypothetical protein
MVLGFLAMIEELTGCYIRLTCCGICATDYCIRVPCYDRRANWVLYQINLLWYLSD